MGFVRKRCPHPEKGKRQGPLANLHRAGHPTREPPTRQVFFSQGHPGSGRLGPFLSPAQPLVLYPSKPACHRDWFWPATVSHTHSLLKTVIVCKEYGVPDNSAAVRCTCFHQSEQCAHVLEARGGRGYGGKRAWFHAREEGTHFV